MVKQGTKEMRIFISSTFQDMQDERDHLVNIIFPQLSSIAAQRNVTLTEIDLRWGITAEEADSFNVIDICLDEINNSRPFFIGILGSRYGWCPTLDELNRHGGAPDRYHWLEDDLANGRSITEIEMQYGALRNAQTDMNALFLIKNGDDSNDDPRLSKLKAEIETQERYPHFRYDTVEEFGEQVFNSVMDILDRIYPISDDAHDPIAADKVRQYSYMVEKCSNYLPIERYDCKWREFIESTTASAFAIVGKSGMGKSAFAAHNILAMMADSSADDRQSPLIITRFVYEDGVTPTPKNVLESITGELLHDLDLDASCFSDYEPKERLEKALSHVADDRRVVIILDSIDHYVDDQLYNVGSKAWLPEHGPNVKIILTTTEDDSELISDFSRIEIKPLHDQEILQLIAQYMGQYRKRLSKQQTEAIFKTPAVLNTMVLVALLDDIRRFGKFEDLDEYIQGFTTMSGPEEVILRLLDHKDEVITAGTGVDDLLPCVLTLLLVSAGGLKEDEILNILDIPMLYWSRLLSSCKTFITGNNGLYSLSHNLIKEVVRYKYADGNFEDDYSHGCRWEIVEYFINNASEDPRRFVEVTTQLIELKETKQLFNFVRDPEFLKYCYIDNHHDLFIKVWTILYSDENRADYNPSVYLNLISPTIDLISPELYYATSVAFEAIHPLIWLAKICINNLKDTATSIQIINALKLYAHKGSDEVRQWLLELVSDTEMVINTGSGEFKNALYNALQAISREDISDKYLYDQLNNIAHLYITMAERNSDNRDFYLKAEHILSELLPLRIELLGDDSTDVAATAANLAGVYNVLGRGDEAIELRKMAMEIYRRHEGYYSEDVAIEYNNIANGYLNTKRYAEALDAFEKSYDIYLKLYGPDNINTGNAQCGMILALRYLNKHERMLEIAEAYLTRFASIGYNETSAIAIDSVMYVDDPLLYTKAFNIINGLSDQIAEAIDDDVIPIGIYINIGDFYSKINLQDKAYQCFDLAAEKFDRVGDESHKYFALFRKAMAYTNAGDYEHADGVCREIMKHYEDNDNISDPNYIMTIGILARNQIAAGNLDEAEKLTRLNIDLRQAREDCDDEIISQLENQLAYIANLKGVDDSAKPDAESDANVANNDSEYIHTVLSLIDDSECQLLFIAAYDKYKDNFIDEASISFENLAQRLNEDGNNYALAHVYRYIALCREFSFRYNSDSAAEYYEKSISMSEWALDYDMCARTVKDFAEMYWNLGDYIEAIKYYWRQIYYLFKAQKSGSELAEIAFENIAVALTKIDPTDFKALLSVSVFASWAYGSQPYFESRGSKLFNDCINYAINNLGIEDFEFSHTYFIDLFEYLYNEDLYMAIYALSMVIPINEDIAAHDPEFTARMAYFSSLALEKMCDYTTSINTAYKAVQLITDANGPDTQYTEELFTQLGYLLFDQRYYEGLTIIYPHVKMDDDPLSIVCSDITLIMNSGGELETSLIEQCKSHIDLVKSFPEYEEGSTIRVYADLLSALIGVNVDETYEDLKLFADEFNSCECLALSVIAAVKAGYTTEALNTINNILDILQDCIDDDDRGIQYIEAAYDSAYAAMLMDRKPLAEKLISKAKLLIGDDNSLKYISSSLDQLSE